MCNTLFGTAAYCRVLVLLALVLGARTVEAQPLAYVANEGSNTVSVINTASNTVIAAVPVGVSPGPIAIKPGGAFAYVGNFSSRTLSVIATASNTVVAVVAVGGQPHGLAITPDGAFAYTTESFPHQVSVIDTASNTVIGTVAVGDLPTGIGITPDGAFAYVTNLSSDNVSVIATASNTVVATIPVGSGPGQVAVTPDGAFAYVTNVFGGSVSVIATSSNSVVTTVVLGGSPVGVAVTPDGAFAYVTKQSLNAVSVISTASNTVVATVPVGNNPQRVAVTSDGAFAYVTNRDSGDVSVIATASNTVVATIPVGNHPSGIAITNNLPGTILISEIRTFGPGGAGDDFVEIYNNTGAPHTVTASDISAGYGLFRMGATCADTPVLVGIIPNGTVIPARGHYLFVGSQYSLTAAAAGNLTMSSDLGENANIGLFNTADAALLSTRTRLDAVGFGTNFGNNCDLLREGAILPAVNAAAVGLSQHSFYRSLCSYVPGPGCTVANPGFPSDRNNNASDFIFVDTNATNATGLSRQHRLGAPGPENMASARVNDSIGAFLLDATKSSSAIPNRVRKVCGPAEECDPNRSQFGTMSIRKRFTNSTGATVTQLRVRIVELTTLPRPDAATADIRPITSLDVSAAGVNDAATCAAESGSPAPPCTVTVKGTTVQAPAQALGGGYNTTMVVALPAGGLTNGSSVNLQFLLGIQQTGNFRFLLNVEALP
jgi:YVTN family beta-propeller protein